MMEQVPEDLQSILSDSTLHNGSAELTTKEILSRYGDIVRGNLMTPQKKAQAADVPLSASSSTRMGGGPVATRVDIDPSQTSAWQKQSSVRPVQNAVAGLSGSQQELDYAAPNSPYVRERGGSQSSQGSYGTGSARQSFQPKPGALGVAT